MSTTRRNFLKTAAATSTLASFSAATPGFLLRSAAAAATDGNQGDTVLIVLQLSGGNDGLNTLVPYGDDEYGRNRPTLGLPTQQLHKIDSLLGWHPRMGAFKRLFDDGQVSVVQGVGYEKQNRNHDTAMRIWHTAQPQRPECQTGWIGRVADRAQDPDAGNVPAAFVGPIAQPFALNAEKAVVPSIRSLRELTIQPMPGSPKLQSQRHASEIIQETGDDALLDFLRRADDDTQAAGQRVEAVANASTNTSPYPALPLARTLHTVAQLIRADLGIRIFFVELGGGGIGGFDNHANQLGNHCALLGQLSESIAVLVDDLKRDKLLDRVLLMTFSEFGRTLKENGRRGTGHGAAAPVFLAGGRLKGGLFGEHPSLTDLDDGAPRSHVDFRSVYATVLERWLGFDSRPVLGKQYETLDLLQV